MPLPREILGKSEFSRMGDKHNLEVCSVQSKETVSTLLSTPRLSADTQAQYSSVASFLEDVPV